LMNEKLSFFATQLNNAGMAAVSSLVATLSGGRGRRWVGRKAAARADGRVRHLRPGASSRRRRRGSRHWNESLGRGWQGTRPPSSSGSVARCRRPGANTEGTRLDRHRVEQRARGVLNPTLSALGGTSGIPHHS
jgi:hypothetical protein